MKLEHILAAALGVAAALAYRFKQDAERDIKDARAMAEGAQNAIIQHFQSHPAEDDAE